MRGSEGAGREGELVMMVTFHVEYINTPSSYCNILLQSKMPLIFLFEYVYMSQESKPSRCYIRTCCIDIPKPKSSI